jgi:hypothetical protein
LEVAGSELGEDRTGLGIECIEAENLGRHASRHFPSESVDAFRGLYGELGRRPATRFHVLVPRGETGQATHLQMRQRPE